MKFDRKECARRMEGWIHTAGIQEGQKRQSRELQAITLTNLGYKILASVKVGRVDEFLQRGEVRPDINGVQKGEG